MATSFDQVSRPPVGPTLPKQPTSPQPTIPQDARSLMNEPLCGTDGVTSMMGVRLLSKTSVPNHPELTKPTNQSNDGRTTTVDSGDARQLRPDNNRSPPPRPAQTIIVPQNQSRPTLPHRNRKSEKMLPDHVAELVKRHVIPSQFNKHRIVGAILPGCSSDIEHSQDRASSDSWDEFLSVDDGPLSSVYGTPRSQFNDGQDSVDRSRKVPVIHLWISGLSSPSSTQSPRHSQTDKTTLLSAGRSPTPSPPSTKTPSFDSTADGDESDASSRKRARTTLKRPRRLRPQNLAPLSSPPSTRTPSSDSSTGDDESDASSGKRRRTTLELPPERQALLRRARRGKTRRPVPAWRDSLVRERGYKSS